jgi:hypothetical protein
LYGFPNRVGGEEEKMRRGEEEKRRRGEEEKRSGGSDGVGFRYI